MSDLFLQATKAKLRFTTNFGGELSTEQLWDLPLQHKSKANLDDIAIGLSRKIKDHATESFVTPSLTSTATEELALDVVRKVIEVRQEEQATRVKAAELASERERLKAIIAQKKTEELVGTDLAELEKRLAAIS